MSLRATSKRWIKKSLASSGVLRIARQVRRQGITILMYHAVQDDPSTFADTVGEDNAHSTSVFAEQMATIARHHNPVTLEDIRLILTEQKPMPRRPVAVTFDDGYADNFEIVAPILRRFGIRASFYATVDCIDRAVPPWVARLRFVFYTSRKPEWHDASGRAWPLRDAAERSTAFLAACSQCAGLTNERREEAIGSLQLQLDTDTRTPENNVMMTWDMLRRLSSDGHIIGSHTMTHPNLAYLSESEAGFELRESKRRLEEQLGVPIVHFCYPNPSLNPHWTQETVALSRQAGYTTAVIATPGLVLKHHNLLRLPRLPAPRQMDDFLWELESISSGPPD